MSTTAYPPPPPSQHPSLPTHSHSPFNHYSHPRDFPSVSSSQPSFSSSSPSSSQRQPQLPFAASSTTAAEEENRDETVSPAHSSSSSISSSVASTSSTSTSSGRDSRLFDQDPNHAPVADTDELGRSQQLGGAGSAVGVGGRTPRSHGGGSVGSLATTVSSGSGDGSPKPEDEGGGGGGGEQPEGRVARGVPMEVEVAQENEAERERKRIEGLSVIDASATEMSWAPSEAACTKLPSSPSLQQPASPPNTQQSSQQGSQQRTRPNPRRQHSTSAHPTQRHAPPPDPRPVDAATDPKKKKNEAGIATAPSVSLSPEQHVDIVSYPSADLLRLLAALLEQIAQANDARNVKARTCAADAASTSNATSTPAVSSQRSAEDVEGEESWAKGRFDAAPLNTPITPRARRRRKLGGEGGPGILDNAMDEEYSDSDDEEEEEEDDVPLTPGMDLLRQTGNRGCVEGFMPSLGGTHRPQPLARRRGSSFIRNRGAGLAGLGGIGGGMTPLSAPSSSSATSTSQPPSASTSTSTRPPAHPLSSTSPSTSFNTLQSGTLTSPTPPPTSLLTASALALSSPSATLCFHARNVPAISIEAYLLRILKYCPTTNEVFLALLVYLDRMARVGLEAKRLGLPGRRHSNVGGGAGEQPSLGGGGGGADGEKDGEGVGEGAKAEEKDPAAAGLFAIDSFNVHRLVIAGITVASKFFSDVFYTNSRYAKVGGLPLSELNQLELQFLLLNDFRLKIPTDELQRYADQLILYWVGRDRKTPHPASNPLPLPPVPRPIPSPSQDKGTPARPESPSEGSVAAQWKWAGFAGQAKVVDEGMPRPSGSTSTLTPSVSSPTANAPAPRPSSSSKPTTSTSTTTTTTKRPPTYTHPSHASTTSFSSAASVASSVSSSTVTPGTPSTTRTLSSSRGGFNSEVEDDEDNDGEHDGDEEGQDEDEERWERGRQARMDRVREKIKFDDGWSTASPSPADSPDLDRKSGSSRRGSSASWGREPERERVEGAGGNEAEMQVE
ncbi:hypothetical protein JCM11641_000857 [Rhodosporidiobolus odoratus]